MLARHFRRSFFFTVTWNFVFHQTLHQNVFFPLSSIQLFICLMLCHRKSVFYCVVILYLCLSYAHEKPPIETTKFVLTFKGDILWRNICLHLKSYGCLKWLPTQKLHSHNQFVLALSHLYPIKMCCVNGIEAEKQKKTNKLHFSVSFKPNASLFTPQL